nr:dystonin isoform X10 [Halyomorpha halys]
MSFLERQADGTIDKQAYEENLSKFKDERDAIQKKTFTKWVNKHLKKAHRHVNDLFTDLQDGHNLISLLEVLSGEQLPREKGRMRFHMLQNVELVLNFLRYKKIKLVNIRPEDIVDGNPKLTLGLIWTIILHFQISDIVVGEEPNVSAKDVLLRWAKKSTAKYPGVKVSDFTSSWRDGLAFNAIIHRNRPDLLPEWREIRRRTVRERLETAFYTAEKVGVTRLLDPEDVDTHEIDEKSIITYISSMYDVFPEPPFAHPLYDNEAQALTSEYREVASSLHLWIREKISEMSQDLPSNYDELRRLAHDSAKFRSEEVPARLRDRQKLSSLYRDLQKLYESTGEVEIEPELHIDVLEKNWSKLQSLHQERDHAIQEELKKLDRLQRLAEKVSRDCKRLEPRMDDLESRISDEAKRLDRLHPLDAKHVVDSIESELRSIEENIQSLFQDVSTLKAGGHHQYPELNKRVGRLHSRWVQLRSALHSKLITRLASLSFPVVEERTVTRQTRTVLETRLVDTNHHFRALQEAIDWVKSKLKQLQEFEFSSDLSGAKIEMTHHQREHREIDRFQSTVDQCASAKSQFHGEELSLYTQHLSTLQKIYAELLSLSNKRISEFETYVDFLESITTQLAWLKEKESIEVARDWSDKEVNITAIQQYYENLMAELERAEVVVRSLLERGESLLLQGHPASKAISVVLGSLQSAWSRVLQFTLALETHIATTRTVQNFFRDLEQLRDWIHSRDEILNTTYSASEFSLDEGERLLRGMQELREELNSRSTALSQMAERAQSVAPIKQRRQPVVRPIQVTAVCDYKSDTVEIEKGDQWILHDNSALTKWRVSPIGSTKDTNVPGVVFLIPPPSKEAKEAVESLARDFDRTTALWQRKQLRLRQNMIFTTIRVVRSWDLAQFVAMGSEQRNAIRKALNEDADKLLAEGDPNDPQLRRLRREMAEVNRLFDEFEALANQQEENKNAIRAITEKCSHLQEALEEAERVLTMRLSSSIPRDVHSLEHLIVQHKEFETSLKGLTGEIEGLQSMFNSLTRKTPGVQSRVEAILQQWNHIWNYSHLFVERLKCVEITLSALDDATNVVSELELKLSSFGDMPSDLESLQNVHDDLIRVQNSIAAQQPVVDQLIEDATNTRRLVVKSRERLRSHDHSDMDRLDDDVNAVTQRWNNLCASLVDRLRCCEAAYSLLDTYGKTYQTEVKFIDESYSELNNLPPVSHGKHHIEPTKVLFTSIVERTQPLEQVNIDGGRFIREAKQAMEEKYKLCDDNLQSLLEWIGEIEARLAQQEPVQEDLDRLRNQINILKLLKEELDSQQRMVFNCLEEVRTVASTGNEYLTRDEVSTLERNGKSLRSRYDRAIDRTDKLLKRLTNAGDHLSKFKSETKSLTEWMTKAKRQIEEKERQLSSLNANDTSVRELLGDVIAHQADLRFISMAANKFYEESKEFLSTLNDFRTSLQSRLSHIDYSLSGSEIKGIVNKVSNEYRDLLSRANALSDKVTGLNAKKRDFDQALERLRQWMSTAEPRANKALSEPLAADPHGLEEQLNRAKTLNNEFLAQGRLVDNMKQALDSLPKDPSITGPLEATVSDLARRYSHLSESLSNRCGILESALAQSQGVEDSLDSITSWLSSAENSLKSLSRPASLLKDRLEDQIRELRLLLSDIDTHRDTVDGVVNQAKALVGQQSNHRLAKRVETKLKDVLSRFEKLSERASKRSELLGEITAGLTSFSAQASETENWLTEANELLSTEGSIESLLTQRESKREIVEKVLREGRALVSKKDVTDTGHVRDRLKNIESSWRELNTLLDERQRLIRSRAEHTQSYEKLRDQVLSWLQSMESRIASLEPTALQMEVLKRQAEEIKPLIKEHKEYASTVDRLFDIGSSLESMARSDSPTRRRSSTSPIKRISSSSLLRRNSQEGSPSPTKSLFNVTSPLSTASSGFGSRRSSQDIFHVEEVTGVQQELSEINNRYSSIGVKVNERLLEIDNCREELRKATESLKSLDSFLERISRSQPREGLPNGREEADKINRVLKGLVEEMYEKQSALDSTRTNVNELLRKRPGAIGSDQLSSHVSQVATKWRSLHDSLKARIQFVEDVKDVYDSYELLSNWLSAKERMFAALGPISPDPRMVQIQIDQVQVLREEMRATRPQLDHLVTVCSSVAGATPDGVKLRAKVSGISDRWEELSRKLEDRASSLGAAVDSSRDFDSGLTRLKDALSNISLQVDAIPSEPSEESLRKIQGCERQLEGVRQLLADAEAAGAELCRVLTDPASRSDIQAKLGEVNKQYSLLQAKLDLRKAEIEALVKDGKEFDAAVAKTLGWVSDSLTNLSDRLLISADRDILQQQVDNHEPIYREMLSKEHEVVLLLERGGKREVESLRQQWERLRREATDRQTRLQTCMEHCRKYYKGLEAFIPWLSQVENKLESLSPESFSRRDLDKHLRDLASLRNDVWKKSGEFEHLRSLGETFIGACDVDKDVVTKEISAIRERWDRLNNDLVSKTSRLEELGRRLAETSERLRGMSHSIQRCEDRLGTHDSLSTTADPATLMKLKTLKDEVQALRAPLSQLNQTCEDLDRELALEAPGKQSGLMEEVVGLGERLDDLSERLRDRCSTAESAAVAAQQYNERVRLLTGDMSALEMELEGMKPPGRDFKTLRAQHDQLSSFNGKLSRASDAVSEALALADRLVDSGLSTEPTRRQADVLSRQLIHLEERAKSREEDLDKAESSLRDYESLYNDAISALDTAEEELRRLRPVGSEVETLRSQQAEARITQSDIIEPAGKAVDVAASSGRALIASAGPGVSVTHLASGIDQLRSRWEALNAKMVDRTRKLDSALLQSGKFQEALEGLARWLSDTEEMVANQRPPSADYNVVKAQLQEQKFLIKMINDREESLASLAQLGDEMEGERVSGELRRLQERFNDLSSGSRKRMCDLEAALAAAKLMQDKLVPVVEWMEKAERKVKDMELVPTDEEKIQQRIREHDALHSEILRKKPSLSELTEVGSDLMALVGEDEASGVADRVQDLADRYSALVDASDNIGRLLESSRTGLRHLVLTYQGLQGWMEDMENRLGRHRILAVHTDKLLAQMEDLADLTEEISQHQIDVDGTVDSGLELMKHISSDEAIQLKEKLDSLQRRYNSLTTRGAELLKQAQEGLPLVQQFHNAHGRLVDWIQGAEAVLQSAEPREESINALESDIQEFRPVVENINQIGPQLCSLSPGEGASTIEGLVTRDNRRFDAVCDQIQRKAERLHMYKQRSLEVLGDIDSLLEWFREAEAGLREAEPPSSEANIIRLQLKEHRALSDDIASQRGRVRDVLVTAKKVIREASPHDDSSLMRDKMTDLREAVDTVWSASGERLATLEQALGLAEHLAESHAHLSAWLGEMETSSKALPPPSIRPDVIAQQQDRTELLLQSIAEHKPLVDKLNKTGEALIGLVAEDEGVKVHEILDSDNSRYERLKASLRERQGALEQALQESSRATDKLEGMLRALASTADELSSLGPVSAHPPRLREQIKEVSQLSDQLSKREEAFRAVKKAAEEVISKAQDKQDPAVKDVRRKLEKLGSLWEELQTATSARGASLQRALEVAGEFWAELESVMGTLADLEASLASQQPPAVRPQAIVKQQQALQEIKAEIDQTKPEVEVVRKRGEKLMSLCGDADKPEVRKHIEDLDTAWDNVTAAFARREENLIHAMERAMEFHGALDEITRLLSQAEERFSRLGPIGADIKTVKKQIEELKEFKADVDPHMVKVEALNRQAGDLSERTSAEESQALRGPLSSVNSRWDTLTRGMAERARHLEQSLLRLGQFQHALSELIAWIDATDKTLDEEIRPTAGDPHLLEVQLAKLKVLVNDIQAHQSSVDTLNDAGRQLVETGQGSLEASTTQEKLKSLNRRWDDLLGKVASRRSELEEALRDAQRFNGEVQDMFGWLAEVDAAIAASKPAGGLPETASEQLERFMEIYNDLESARPKVEALLTQGNDYLKRAEGNNAQGLSANLKALKQRWEAVQGRANDKKIKLEIALKEATEFHNALQSFVDWLTSAEKTLANLKPVSRVLETILTQIEEHKLFQKEVGVHRETMIQLDKKGTHLKYFSQKQDVILIKNLLISVQHRWERVVSKSAERTRALDHGYKEAKEFHDLWSNLMNWLSETDKKLDEITTEIAGAGNDPVKLKARLAKHKETQKAIAQKQGAYDQTMRVGKTLRERAPKSDESKLKTAVSQLRELWSLVSSKAVTGQRKLEEALLYCGQFKEALESLLDWLKRTEKTLSQETRIYGDLDTVQNLIEQHKVLEEELRNRSTQMESLERSGRELSERADSTGLKTQLIELNKLWTTVVNLASDRSTALKAALKHAEELHKAVHMLLEWLSDAEMRLRFVDSLPDDEAETRVQIAEHDKFMREMTDKEKEKDSTIALAEKILAKAHPDGAAVIKHWITIIQSRWEEVSSWAKQRSEKLHIHLNSLRDMDTLLEELLSWLALRESDLLEKESRDLPNIIPETERLIVEHDSFMEETMTREVEVNSVFRAKQLKEKKTTKKTSKDETRQSTQELNEIQRRQSMKSSREHLTNLDRRTSFKSSREHLSTLDRKTSRSSPAQDMIDGHPRIGPKFPPKGSKTLEPQFRCARSRLLYERWRGVWQQSWERQRRLRDHLAHLQELDRLANFSWDDWRKRFLKFMNHKKSRLTDLFRKMDKNNDGLIPRDDFIDGIIKTKFDTSKLEMGAVADMFDHNSEGYIDWKEFIAALRPDWEERKPATEAEKIHDEVKRLVMLCTCRQKFRVFQVGEGKYRFGDSQKLRLVRILRSTVMVRVGGGWVALEEFLVKNDPCRAGELLSELMPIFESLRAKEALPCAFPLSVVGQQGHSPHTCRIREKSERSVPMSGRRSTESGRSPGSTPGSAPSSRPASRSGSRPGSRPISRHSSSLSLATSEEGTPSRIPRWSRGKPSVNGSGGTRTQIPESSSSTSSISSRSFSGSSIPRPIRSPAGTKTPTARRESFKL